MGLSLPAGAEVNCASLSLVVHGIYVRFTRARKMTKTMKMGWNLVSLRNLRLVKRKSLTVRGIMHLPESVSKISVCRRSQMFTEVLEEILMTGY